MPDIFEIIQRTAAPEGGAITITGISQAQGDNRWLRRALNLSDLDSAPSARSNLGLGALAVLDQLEPLTAGDGISGVDYVGTTARTFSVAVEDPIEITAGGNVGIKAHGDDQAGVIIPTAQGIYGAKTFHESALFTNEAKLESSVGFTAGFLGAGFQHERVNERWRLELDDLFVRGSLFAYEFIIQQISAINGSDILSAGVGKVEEVESQEATGYEVKVSDATGNNISPFAVGDIVLIQQVTPDAFSGGGQIVKRVVGNVSSVDDNLIGVTTQDGTDGTQVDVGDVMVVIGSSVAGRQSLIYRTVIEQDAPFVRVMTDVDSVAAFSDLDNVMMQYGNLESVANTSGSGLYAQNAFLTGNLVVGDLTKTDNFLAYEDGDLEINVQKFGLFSDGVDITNTDGITFNMPETTDPLDVNVTLTWIGDPEDEDQYAHIGARVFSNVSELEYMAERHLWRNLEGDSKLALTQGGNIFSFTGMGFTVGTGSAGSAFTVNSESTSIQSERIKLNLDDLPKSSSGLDPGELYLSGDGLSDYEIRVVI